MKAAEHIDQKIMTLEQAQQWMLRWRLLSRTVAFTNGVFDIVHAGHIHSLRQAAALGDVLVVAINSDASTSRLKGETRPINTQQDRALVLAAMEMVDAVVVFEEDTPLQVITSLMPDVLVKGGDYTVDTIVGAREVLANGGKVEVIPLVPGLSTTALAGRISKL